MSYALGKKLGKYLAYKAKNVLDKKNRTNI